MFQLKNYLPEFSIKAPDFYTVDQELNKSIELYMASLKKGTVKPPEAKSFKSTKSSFKSKLEIDIDAETDPELSTKFQTSLHGFSNDVISHLMTPNFKSAQQKDLFKPPIVRNANNPLSPKIRIISPTGNVKDGMKVIASGSGQSLKAISDFNPFTSLRGNGEYKAVGATSPLGSPNESMSDSYVNSRENSR